MIRASVPPRAIALLALLTLVWGTNWMLFPMVTREISVWTFRAVSMVIAGVVLLAVARRRGASLALPARHRRVVISAALAYLAVWNIASTYAARMIPSGQAALLGFTMPLWAALISFLVLKERLGGRMLLAMALGAAGVGLLMSRSLDAYLQAPLGVALGLLAGIGWAAGTLLLKRGAVDIPATVLTGWQLLIAAVPITLGAWLLRDPDAAAPSVWTWALVLYIALVPTAIGNLAWFAIVGLLPANVAGLSSILVPVVAMVAGSLVHAEPLGLVQWAAMACCVGALALALLKPGRI